MSQPPIRNGNVKSDPHVSTSSSSSEKRKSAAVPEGRTRVLKTLPYGAASASTEPTRTSFGMSVRADACE